MTFLTRFRTYRLATVAAAVVAVASCGKNSYSPAAPGQTAALAAPTAKSPVGGAQTEDLQPMLEVNNAAATGNVGTVTYRFELSELPDFPQGSRSVAMENVAQGASSTSVRTPSKLHSGQVYYWHARASNGTITTSYSTTESFRADNDGFVDGQTIYDPLTSGETVAHERHGGHFVSGDNAGWQADSRSDSLDYNIPTCTDCRVEFEVTNVDRSTPPINIDQKFFSMGDGRTFNDFIAFRNHVWKMHIEKRSGDGGSIKLIWRRGCADDGGCDNEHNLKAPIAWNPSEWYRFTIEWGAGAMGVHVCRLEGTSCGATIYTAAGTGTYAPPNHRIELGTRPRNETLLGARFRNVKVSPR